MSVAIAAILAISPPAFAAPRGQSALPEFSDYPTSPAPRKGKKAPLRLTKEDLPFKSRLRMGYRESVNFAGKYVLTFWGCGMECLMGAAIDTETGTVHWLPGTACCWSGDEESGEPELAPFEFRIDSRLIVIGGYVDEKGVKGSHYYRMRDGNFEHLVSQPVVPTAKPVDNVPPAPTWRLIILGGSTTAKEAEKLLARAKQVAGLVHSETLFTDTTRLEAGAPLFGKGFPQLVSSDAIAGLKPGFKIVIGGYCENAAEAETARDLSRLHFPAAYLRPTQPTETQRGPAPCPQAARSVERSSFVGKRVASSPVDRAAPSLRWQVLSGKLHNERTDRRCPAVAVELRSRDRVLERRYWIDDCEGPDDSACIHFMFGCSTYQYDRMVVSAGRTFPILQVVRDIRYGNTTWVPVSLAGTRPFLSASIAMPTQEGDFKPAGEPRPRACGYFLGLSPRKAVCIDPLSGEGTRLEVPAAP